MFQSFNWFIFFSLLLCAALGFVIGFSLCAIEWHRQQREKERLKEENKKLHDMLDVAGAA